MLSKSSWLHLRFPFSFFLMPVYFFALAVSPNFNGSQLLWSFLIIHLLLYPASNGFNSYFDKDTKSIGGLKHPPPVTRDLYYISILLDVLAVLLAYLKINLTFAVLLFVYGLASKAYSHPLIRLKKYPVGGWLTVGFFQGFFTFIMCYAGINKYDWANLLTERVCVPAALASLILLGTYPMTQIYQHEEDSLRGDITLSLKLGIHDTFRFVFIVFTFAAGGFIAYFFKYHQIKYAVAFLLALGPVVLYFLIWWWHASKDLGVVNFSRTMGLNFISALCLNGFFIWLFLEISNLLQL